MGIGYEWECPKCGYKFTGSVGRGFNPTEYEVFRCRKCGEYDTKVVSTPLFLPKMTEAGELEWEIDPESGVDPADYDRKCRTCGGRMVRVPESRYKKGMKCPNCQTPLEIVSQLLWD